jgi:hypothetical protein
VQEDIEGHWNLDLEGFLDDDEMTGARHGKPLGDALYYCREQDLHEAGHFSSTSPNLSG